MIRKLRLRFILITMVAVFAMMAMIIAAINVVNYHEISANADRVVDVLVRGGGKFPMNEQENSGQRPPESNGIDGETPYETRYFTVRYVSGESGVTAQTDTSAVALIDEEKAVEMADKVLASGKTRGYYEFYRFRVTEEKGDTLTVFVDSSRMLESARTFLRFTLIFPAIGFVVIFLFVVFWSKKAVAPIAESHERQKRFITDAGHELKTPLTIISANNELLEMTTGESEYTEVIARQVERMTATVKNLTTLARMDEMQTLENKEAFSLSEAVLDVAHTFIGIFEQQGKKLTFATDGKAEMEGDEALIRQLVYILLDNAAKYSLTYTKVEVAEVGVIKKAVLTVTNDAAGMSAGDLDRVFERFYRSDATRGSGIEGSGIGLSIAKEIVGLHKGEISASGTDKGEFIVKAAF